MDRGDKIIIDRKALLVLASETRIEILKKLDERRMTLTEVSESLNMPKTAVKEHLDRLVEAELVERVDEGRKWIYYGLTGKGRRILHPESRTKVILLLSSAVASMAGGLFELYKFVVIRSSVPIPTPAPAPVPVPTPPETHLLVGLALISLGAVMILCWARKYQL